MLHPLALSLLLTLSSETGPSLAVLFDRTGNVGFVPERAFGPKGELDLPVSSEGREELSRRLAQEKKLRQKGENPSCQRLYFGTGVLLGEGSSLADLVRGNEIAVLGELTDLTPGWDTRANRVSSLVHVRVQEVLKDVSGRTRPASMVTYERPGGTLQIGEISLCAVQMGVDNLPFQAPKVGDMVLLVGFNDLINPSHIITNALLVFPIDRGRVLAGRNGRPASEMRLDDLRGQLTRSQR